MEFNLSMEVFMFGFEVFEKEKKEEGATEVEDCIAIIRGDENYDTERVEETEHGFTARIVRKKREQPEKPSFLELLFGKV
ncbi:MAG: hypothetical protein ABEJ24_03645 [Candidatus Magasanikbacteria bacterium]